ncbi:DNA protecting protein DprA [Pseudomonas saudimassiliensis]|uniref:DNA protecting protein DprA n=1 Tax=Pseudomonas saudimassiliensis TaxID=1461581 RepID=A0A078MEM9_9PSED|nr:DNA-processing protein DprA [Pseudomonas saudimassiliensis]CEA04744.1 DNA protecting protein DprA [Pseudomonas saudimassiliensis]CEF26774.1 DNA protecting protein DprA [Pseudomonas saudimassiliensis]
MPLDITDPRHAWLTLSLLGLSATARRSLLEQQLDPAHILEADVLTLGQLGLSGRLQHAILQFQQGDHALTERVEQCLEWVHQPGCHLLTLDDADYPALLREISDPPLVLFVRGEPALLADPQLAMVGTRHPGPQGAATARAFARDLAASGLVITSGMALGIDGAAHQGALDAGGQTIAVWGTGLDNCYPRRHRRLAEMILDGGGALVSEQPPPTAPHAGLFPQRNRIISGLSLGTLVVEASLNSGSLITARLAMEQNREVFAMPGSIHNPQARGCHRLLRDGAALVETTQDILAALHLPLREALATDPATAVEQVRHPLWRWLGQDPVTADWLAVQSSLPIHQVLQGLLELELDGHVQHTPQGYSRSPPLAAAPG